MWNWASRQFANIKHEIGSVAAFLFFVRRFIESGIICSYAALNHLYYRVSPKCYTFRTYYYAENVGFFCSTHAFTSLFRHHQRNCRMKYAMPVCLSPFVLHVCIQNSWCSVLPVFYFILLRQMNLYESAMCCCYSFFFYLVSCLAIDALFICLLCRFFTFYHIHFFSLANEQVSHVYECVVAADVRTRWSKRRMTLKALAVSLTRCVCDMYYCEHSIHLWLTRCVKEVAEGIQHWRRFSCRTFRVRRQSKQIS